MLKSSERLLQLLAAFFASATSQEQPSLDIQHLRL